VNDDAASPAGTWGPRPHPAPVQAPPPPPPLAAPASPVERAEPATVDPAPGRPAVVPRRAPGPAPDPTNAAAPVADPPTPTRARRWFGRSDHDASEPLPAGAPPAPRRPVLVPPVRPGDPSTPTQAVEPALPPEPDLGHEVVDPCSLGPAVARMSAAARRAGAVSLGILSTVLLDGEVVEVVVQGTYQHQPAVVALTDRRVVVVNERRWRPDVRSIAVTRDLVVQGWQDERQATLVFASEGRSVSVSAVEDRPLARDLARQLRDKVVATGGPPPSAT
jgi:hypothetical protein